jgi:glycine/D-amino acid oxidase-like deaminating enzyme
VPQLGILNGTGTKGVTLAPYFARQLADHIVHGAPILPQADVARFRRLLNPGK